MSLVGPYVCIRTLKKSAECRVELSKHKGTGDYAVIRICDSENPMVDNIINEINVLQEVNHPNIVRLLMSGIDQECVKKTGNKFQGTYCAYELLKGGQLYEFLNETGPFDEYTARFIFHQIINVLEYLSSIGISHSKISLESIMLDENFNIKIRNFQKATIGTTCVSSNLVGSYYAPEVINNQKFTCQIADIFSAGVLLFALVSQANPFYKADSKDPYFKYIANNRLDLFWKIFERNKQSDDYYTKEFKELVNWMLSPDPHERPSLSEIKESEWYNKEVPTSEEVIKEFTKRKDSINNKNMQTELEAPFYSQASVFTGFPVTRSISDDFEESKDIFTSIESFEEKEYIPELSRYTKFFSTSSVFQLISTLFDFGSKQAKSTSISNNELQVKLELADSNDENIEIIVNILKHGKKHCIEVSLDSGDSFEFKRIYSKLLAFFGGHANAVELDELNQSEN